jgi:hypothetical protein
MKDFCKLYKEPSKKPNDASQFRFGIYENSGGQRWIDGSWSKSYGDYQANQRNARVKAAQKAFLEAKINTSPSSVADWKLVG